MNDSGPETAIDRVDESSHRILAEWESLAERLACSPFLHPGFVLAWQRSFASTPLLLASARRGERLVAALPLLDRGHGVLVSPANWHTPECGVLAEDREAANALCRPISQRAARRVSLVFLDACDRHTMGLVDELAGMGYRIAQRSLTRSPYLEPSGDWEAFQASMKTSTRRNLRRLRRRMDEQGAVAFEEVRGGAQLEASLAELLRIEGLAWKGQQGTAIDSLQHTRRFYDDVAHWAAERGWLRVDTLRVGGESIAMTFALESHGVFYGIKQGYDPAYRHLSPGIVLVDELIHQGFERGLKRIELLGTDDSYKRTWCSEAHERVGVQAFAPSISGRVDRLVFTKGVPLAKRVGGRALKRLAGSEGPRV